MHVIILAKHIEEGIQRIRYVRGIVFPLEIGESLFDLLLIFCLKFTVITSVTVVIAAMSVTVFIAALSVTVVIAAIVTIIV